MTPPRTRTRARIGVGSTVAAGALVLLGCAAAPAPADSPEDADIVVTAGDMYYEPERLEVEAGRALQLHLRNDGAIVHDLVFDDGWESGTVRPGEAINVPLDPRTASSVAWCSVPGHRDAGMELEVVVVDAEPTG